MKAQRLAVVLIVGVVVVSTGAGVLLYSDGSDIGSNSQSDGTNSTGDDVAVLNQSADGKVYLDVASDPQRDRADLGHALDGLYDEKSINVSNIDFVESQREASTIAIATDGWSNATYIANWVENHLDHPRANADADSSTNSGATSSQVQCGVEPTYYQIDFVAGEPIEELQGPKGTYTPDELIRFAHSNSEKNDIRRSSNGEFTTNESLRNAVDSKSIRVEDGTAKVSFSISEDSGPVKLTLASYTKPQRIWTRATEHQQEFVDADTRTFKPGGSYTLSADLPDSKVVPCETDTAPDQSNPSTETDTSESPSTPQSSTPSGTPETATSDTTPEATSDTTPGTTTSETTNPETTEAAPGTRTSGTTTSETTNPGTTDAPPTTTTTPPTETPAADLGVTKTVDDANATVGDNVTFTIEVTNNGPNAASNVSVDEMLGSGLAYQSGEVSQGVYDPVTGVYSVGTLANGETATLEITTTIKSSDNTTNAVEVTSDQPDPTDPNNNDSANPTPSVADLSLTKNVDEPSPNVGDNVEYTLTLSNDGPNATSNVTVADALPDGVSYVSSDANQGEYNNGTGLWTVNSLSDGGEATLAIVATVESSDDVTNVAEVNSSDTFDPNSTPNNNESGENDQDNVTINGQSADLAVTKTANATDATVGDNATFTVAVTNNGPDTATNVSVNESLGSGFEFQNASVTQGGYDANTGVYTVGTLDSNDTATLTLTARINSTDNTTNAVEVTSDQPDPNPPNNNDSANPTPSVADLSLTKNVNESAPNVGDNVEYTLTLSNDGPNATSNVTVADALPDGVSYVSSDASQGQYNDAMNLWTVNNIANDSEATLSVVATVDTTDDVTNVAEVNASDTFDPDSTPNNDDPDEDDRGSTTINGQSADLAVSKTVNDTNVTVGDTVAFTVEVTNNGPDAATNVAVDELLGTGLDFQSATVSQGTYDNETSTYAVGTLASDETATLTLTATIESADDTANAAEVTSDTPDPNDPNNNGTVDPSPSVADLSLTKRVNETSPNVGDTIEYTLTLSNDGPNATTNVTVADSLPDGLSDVNTTASQESYDTKSGLWTVGELASGDQSTLTITAAVQSTTDVTNVAEVNSSDTFDPNSTPNNNESGENDQDNSTVNGQSADLAVSKSVDDSGATVGDNVTFSVDVTNTGPDTARNVVVDDALPAGLTFQDASATQGKYDESTGTYTVGDLKNGATATLTLTATINSTDASTLENVATVTSDTFDPDESNNEDSSTPSPQVADLSLTKSVNESAPALGSNVEYTLTLSNDGPNTATGVEVTDALPDGLSLVSADPNTGSYDSGVWTVNELATGEQTTLTLTTTVENTEDVMNTAEVTASDQFDPDSTPGNNVPDEDDQANTTVSGQAADLAVTKTVDDSEPTVGDDVTFTVDVTNDGPTTATNVSVNESLGDGLSFQSARVTQGSYDEGSNVYDVGTLGSGETATLTLTAMIDSATDTTNAVEVTGDQPDPVEPNNNDSATPTPTAADLSLNKTVNESAPSTGAGIAYTLTLTNDGPNATSNVAVEDTLPDGVTLVDANASQGSYVAETGVWAVGDVEDGGTETLTINATVDSAGSQTNTAQVTSSSIGDPDSSPGNDDGGEDDQDSVTTQSTTPQCSVQMSNVTAPDSVDQGQQANIEADVTNTGLANNCGATATLNATGNSSRAVDIVFLVDTSASTDPYIDQIANQLNGFANDLNAQNIDARYAVVSYGGNGYVNTDQKYTSDSQDAINTLNGLRSDGSQERNYAAIQQALSLDSRANANTFLIDVTDEDTDRHSGDPTKTEIANQIDDAGASFIAVSPDETEVEQSELGMKTLSEEVRNGHWVDLFAPGDGPDDYNPDLNDFVSGFQDIVVNQVEEGINRETSVTLDAGESRDLSFTVDTSSFQAGSELEYTVTVGSETKTGTITITGTGSTSMSINAASIGDSSPTANTASQDTANETTATPEMTESLSENTSTTTTTQTATTETSTATATTETETETATDKPTETATTTVDTTTETQTVTETETAAEAAETPTGASVEATDTTTTMVNTTAEASSNTTVGTSPTANETAPGTENTTTAP